MTDPENATAKLHVEVHPTVVPIPAGLVITDKATGKYLGNLAPSQVREVLAQWDAAVRRYEQKPSAPDDAKGSKSSDDVTP